MLEFDREQLAIALSSLSLPRRLALCASSSERLIPYFEQYWVTVSSGPSVFRKALDAVWEFLDGKPFERSQLTALRQEVEKQVPDEDDVAEHYYAQDAAIAVTYSVDVWLTGSKDSVVYCLEQCYNVVTHYVENSIADRGSVTKLDLLRTLEHILVQTELRRQQTEFYLCRTTGEGDWGSLVKQLHTNATQSRVVPN
jgi:uncharacterized protein YjaG (DUF416 family)